MRELYAIDEKFPRALARVHAVNPRAAHIVGVEGGSKRRKYVCRICGFIVDTDAAAYPPTKHALRAAHDHAQQHEIQLAGETAEPAEPIGVQATYDSNDESMFELE